MKRKMISIIRVCFFTEKAKALYEKLKSSLPNIAMLPLECKDELRQWTQEAFEKSLPILFISAAGIAVRTISPFVKAKTTDSPVLVMDEDGKFVIPILSGHLGNANEIAKSISNVMNAQPVITTATDVNGVFSVDDFAKANGFRIANHNKIKTVSSKVLAGKQISIYMEDSILIKDNDIPKEVVITKDPSSADVGITTKELSKSEQDNTLNLIAKRYCLGMGCKKEKPFEELKAFAEATLKRKLNLDFRNDIYCLSSIDLKENEMGLMELSHYLHVPFETFTAEELLSCEGTFAESDFVKETTGVSNVCERAAALSAGKNYKIILNKIASNGMTLSVAEKLPEIKVWNNHYAGES